MLKLKNEKLKSVVVQEMRDGDIAIITEWNVSAYIGQIVQRYRDDLIILGKSYVHSWTDAFVDAYWDNCKVRILEDGEELINVK